MKKLTLVQIAKDAIDLFLEYRDLYSCSEEEAKQNAITEIDEYEQLEKSGELDNIC